MKNFTVTYMDVSRLHNATSGRTETASRNHKCTVLVSSTKAMKTKKIWDWLAVKGPKKKTDGFTMSQQREDIILGTKRNFLFISEVWTEQSYHFTHPYILDLRL
jgi:hypothetical protein